MSLTSAFNTQVDEPDVLLVGSGIMSSTLGVMLKVLQPELRIQMYEVTPTAAQESSHGWNNAGTGHAGLCELSYTPHRSADGTVDVSKALQIFAEFETSRQFWAFAVKEGILPAPQTFVRQVPHLSFVSGAEGVDFLRARHRALAGHPFFAEMEFTERADAISAWAPLLMEGRPTAEPVAATREQAGTDVDFGSLSRGLVRWLADQPGVGVATGQRVEQLRPRPGGGWSARVHDRQTGQLHATGARFVFIGAGGGSLPLLQQTGIPESRGIGGFPIGGQWLVCENPEVVARHRAKVYGQALGAAPTMAVPHLDTRMLDDRRTLLFGPFAAWTTKFLHGGGSSLDLLRSVKPHNMVTLVKIAGKNMDLIRYLLQQSRQTKGDRLTSLREFYPAAEERDWKLIDAGIRVQAIKRTEGKTGIVHYGTEIITDSRRSVAALLGASPGASVSASIALDLVQRCLPHLLQGEHGRRRLHAMVPTLGLAVDDPQQAAAFRVASRNASAALQLDS